MQVSRKFCFSRISKFTEELSVPLLAASKNHWRVQYCSFVLYFLLTFFLFVLFCLCCNLVIINKIKKKKGAIIYTYSRLERKGYNLRKSLFTDGQYFLFKVSRVRVIKCIPRGIYWPPAQGGSGGGKKFFFSHPLKDRK